MAGDRQTEASAPIAVVGAACRLPGAPDLAGFGRVLDEGHDAVTELPADRFTQSRFLHPRPGEVGRALHFRAGTIGEVAGFDATGFGLSPREADEMDPQQRLLLMLARRAFEDAGWPEAEAAGRRIGVYVGASTTDYADIRQQDVGSSDRYIMTGGALSIAANRLGHVFDLRGPAMTLDTACSSGLVALNAACEALRAGHATAAVVGGINLMLSPYPFIGFWRAGMLSKRGRCQAFGAGADGYVRAEGGVVLLLKPLTDARRDGDRIRGVILASGVNAAGRTAGISLPDGEAQSALIAEVLARAGLGPEALGYFEAHGTGTPAGDPIEAAAIARAATTGRAAPLPIGSVKSNIGHTEAASGLVGLLKGLHVLESGRIPATLHADIPNPAIPFDRHGLILASTPMPLQGRAVAVNSFGFGGTNACVALGRAEDVALGRAGDLRENPAPQPVRSGPRGAPPPLLLSAHGAGQLGALAEAWQERLRGLPAPRVLTMIRGQARHRDLLAHRLVLRGAGDGDGDEWAGLLAAHRRGETPKGVTSGVASPGQGVAFVFSGNGAQWAGMAAAEMHGSKVFRKAIGRADAALRPHLGWSVAEALREAMPAEALAATEVAQPLLFAIQYGIVAALAAEGIVPALCLGHSVGEVAAAQAAGLLSLAQAARLIVIRSRAQATTRGHGRMAALGTTAAEAQALIAACCRPGEPPLEIAALNAPGSLTVAGPEAALARLGEAAEARRLTWIPLDLDYAFHSAAMDPVREALVQGLRGLRAGDGRVPMVSSVTGEALARAACNAAYWWRNLREPVRFETAVRAAAALRPAVFLEIGANPVLQGYLRGTLRAAGLEAAILPSLRRGTAEAADPFPAIADQAAAHGADPRGAPGFVGPATRDLPPSPFALRPHWFARTVESQGALEAVPDGRLIGFRHVGSESGEEWRRSIDTLEEPWLADHALGGHPMLPAAAMLEMALEAGFLRHRGAAALEIADFAILRALPLGDDVAREMRVRLDAEGGFTLAARRRLSEEGWTLHAAGRVTVLTVLPEAIAREVRGEWRDAAALAARAAQEGLSYGPAFRPVAAWRAEAAAGRAEVRLELPEAAPTDAGFHLHPVRLDGAMQGFLGLIGGPEGGNDASGFVPVRFGRVAVRRGAALPVSADLVLEHAGRRGATAGLVLRDATGMALAVVTGALFQRLPRAAQASELPAFHTEWHPAALPAAWPEPPPALDLGALRPPRQPQPALDDAALLLAAHGVAAGLAAGAETAEGPLAEALRFRARALSLDSGALPEPEAIWRQVLFEQPILAQELAVLAQAAEALPGALAGRPSGPATLPAGAESLRRLAAALADGAADLLRGWPEGRPCRVLVVGAEDGPLLPALRQALAPLGAALRLTVTHLPGARPPALPQAGEAGIERAVWDPAAEGAPPAEAELVLGLALSPRRAFTHRLAEALRGATAPGGALLLAEPMPGLFWDMTEGLAPGWWSSPRLHDAAGWTGVMTAGGWPHPRQIALPALPWDAALIAAARPAGGQLLHAAPARRFLLWSGGTQRPLCEALAEALAAAGAHVAHLPADPAPRLLRGAAVIALPAPEADSLAPLAQLAALADGVAAQFHLVVRGGGSGLAAAGQMALARVLANEMPGLKPQRHDVAPDLPAAEAASRLVAALLDPPDAEAEQRLTASARLVPRLAAALPPSPPPAGPRRLEVAAPGQLGSLAWEAAPDLCAPPGPGEVRLRIAAAGLNFRDVMWAQGLLPEEALQPGFAGPGLGMEAAGVVEAVGAGVALRPGQQVFGFAPRALATRAVTQAAALAPLPRGLSMEEAASLPVAFLTVIHALEGLARIQPGERVLIHGGAGAVGLAALQIALAAGARVAVTAGTEARRAFLRAAGAEVALDSRDGSFAERLRAVWPAPPGEGCVDICLNSLSGEAMERSLGLMAPFGRFLELGKRDFAEARRVTLRPMRRNVAWFAVDLDEVARHRPALASRMLASLATRLEDGAIRPLPIRVHESGQAEEAFRQLQAGGHIGKLVITPPAELAGDAAQDWRPKGSVVVVGGTAGFGLEAACWLAGQGIRHLALVSRRGPATPGAAAALTRLRTLGAEARIFAADAADPEALAAALDGIRAGMPPIEGVVHAAAVFADGVAARLDPASVATVWAAKAIVAENLDRLTRDDALRLFLLFSSATVPIGSPGQAAYVAANAALDALARRRHAAGWPALAVQWGPIADAGVLAGDAPNAAALSQRLGATALRASEALGALPALLASGLPVIGLARVDWEAARRSLRLLAEPAFAPLTGAFAADSGEQDPLRAIAEAGPDGGLEIARRLVAREVARILRLPPGAVPADTPLTRLGLDSLGSIELRTGLERRFSVSIPLRAVTEELTVSALARAILAQVPAAREAAE
ncbi:type I polyketide synthase [Roseococcus sp. SYP-B2431]|uniref:type I polyketide synthase n=1 Tax=Roseococcus sp. SYP-B2431 TaxID=2496640 RepID=UPI0013F3EF1C|nr:type I polyketide synthase [Roseococcus sp. SYP-B2431]